MAQNRTRNVKRNAIWGMLNRIVCLLMPFITRTVIIRVLGSEYLGLNGLFTSVLTVLNLTELGIGSAIVYAMYKPLANQDVDLVCALLALYKKIYRIIGIVIIVLGVGLTPFINYLINGDVPNDINVYSLYLLYVANTAISYLLFAYKTSLLHATQRSDLTSKINLIVQVLLNSLQILFLVITHNYYYFIILQVVFTIVTNISNSYVAKKVFPQYICHGFVNQTLKKDIKKRISGLMMIKIAFVSRNALDSIIISSFLGLNLVAVYSNYYLVISGATSLLIVLMNAIAASVGNSIATETKMKNLMDMRIINFLYLSISGACAAVILCIFQDFMLVWVGSKLLFSEIMMVLFVFYFVLMKIGDVQAQYFDAAGLWWHGRMRGIIEACANLVLNIVLGYFWGVFGILLATIITIILINFPLSTYYTFRYYYECSPFPFIREQILIIGKIVICCIPAFFLSKIVFVSGGKVDCFLNIGFKSVISVLSYCIIFVLINYKCSLANLSLSWAEARFLCHRKAGA